jgi:hypothetical protein
MADFVFPCLSPGVKEGKIWKTSAQWSLADSVLPWLSPGQKEGKLWKKWTGASYDTVVDEHRQN